RGGRAGPGRRRLRRPAARRARNALRLGAGRAPRPRRLDRRGADGGGADRPGVDRAGMAAGAGGGARAGGAGRGPVTAAPDLDALAQAIHDAGGDEVVGDPASSAVDCRLPAPTLPALADRLAALGLEPQWIAAADTRAASGAFTLAYRFAPPTHRPAVTARVAVGAERAAFPSLATRSFAASRFERETQDLFGLVPTGHPDPRRLALHQFWPEGYYPLRRDTATRADVLDDGRPFPFRRVEGRGVFEITVGPVHARLTGHRLLRGAVVPGGVTGPIATAELEPAAREVERVVAEFVDIAGLSLDNTMVLERLQGTGRLTNRTAREMQVVGMVARASG